MLESTGTRLMGNVLIVESVGTDNLMFSTKQRKRTYKPQRSKEKGRTSRNDHSFMSITAQKKNDWLLDSGASSHMSYDKSEFVSLMDLESPIKTSIANGTTVEAVSTGSISVSLSIVNMSPFMTCCTFQNCTDGYYQSPH